MGNDGAGQLGIGSILRSTIDLDSSTVVYISFYNISFSVLKML